MEIIDQFVEFDKYCKTCKHKDLKGHFDPCNDCLDSPVNIQSAKPIHYEKKETPDKKSKKK